MPVRFQTLPRLGVLCASLSLLQAYAFNETVTQYDTLTGTPTVLFSNNDPTIGPSLVNVNQGKVLVDPVVEPQIRFTPNVSIADVKAYMRSNEILMTSLVTRSTMDYGFFVSGAANTTATIDFSGSFSVIAESYMKDQQTGYAGASFSIFSNKKQLASGQFSAGNVDASATPATTVNTSANTSVYITKEKSGDQTWLDGKYFGSVTIKTNSEGIGGAHVSLALDNSIAFIDATASSTDHYDPSNFIVYASRSWGYIDPVFTLDPATNPGMTLTIEPGVGNTHVAAVPEPETYAMLLGGLGLLGLIARRRKA